VSDLPERVEEAVRQRRLFRRGEAILVAVSGGLDSMALLHLLARLAPTHGWRLAVAHFNHQLRGRSSDADERLVERTARQLGLPFAAGRADVRKFAGAHKLSMEMAARNLRHAFLARTARKRGTRTIALAHHADDQVELFLLRLLRGAGGTGLGGMKWRGPSPENREISLVRPLLGETKAALSEWVAREKIAYREDASNARLDMQRNRIRHELLPLLARHYQSATARVLLRQMEILGAEAEFVTAAAEKWLGRRGGGRFGALPLALQRRCLQIQLERLGLPVSFELIEQLREHEGRPVTVGRSRALAAVGVPPEGGSGGMGRADRLKAELQARTYVSRDSAGRLSLAERGDFSGREMRVRLRGRAGEIAFANRAITWQIEPLPDGIEGAIQKRVNIERFDADKVGRVIGLRHWRPGDRFQPIGMGRAVKLQDLFVNQKISRNERRELVVATSEGGELFWVEGLRMAERFKLDKSTRRGLKWTWERL
jgi:tRNA(Ile)-lysidine synthase